MKIIAIISRKGGSGKSTIAKHMAVEACKHYKNVGLVDFDPQGSVTRWFNKRDKKDAPYLVTLDLKNIQEQMKDFEADGANLLIIDTAGVMIDALQNILKVSDFVIVPVRPTEDDMELLEDNVQIVAKSGLRPLFVITDATPNESYARYAFESLAKIGAVLGTINRTKLFSTASAQGLTVTELPTSITGNVLAVQQIKDTFKALNKQIKMGN